MRDPHTFCVGVCVAFASLLLVTSGSGISPILLVAFLALLWLQLGQGVCLCALCVRDCLSRKDVFVSHLGDAQRGTAPDSREAF